MILQAVEVFFKRRLRILFKNMPVTLQCFAWMVGVLGVAMGGCRKGKGVVLDGWTLLLSVGLAVNGLEYWL